MVLIPENWGLGNFYPQQSIGNNLVNNQVSSIPMLPPPTQVSSVLRLRGSNSPPTSVVKPIPRSNPFTESVDNLVKPTDYEKLRILFDKITPEQTIEKIYPRYSSLMNINSNKTLLEELIVILYIQCKNYLKFLFILRSTVNVKQDGQYNLSTIINYIHKCKDTIKLIDEISNKIKNIIRNYPTLTINTPIGKNLDYIENFTYTYNNLYDEAIRLYFYHSDSH